MSQIGRLNAIQATNSTQASTNVNVTEAINIPIGKGNKALSGKTVAALTNPQPGDFMHCLNKIMGMVDFSA